MTLTPLIFEATPDRLAFEARKYGNRGLWLMFLPSGRIAVADANRQLVAILDLPIAMAPNMDAWNWLQTLLAFANVEPPPPTRPESPLQSLDPELDDLELKI